MTSINKLTVPIAMIVSLLTLNAYAQSRDPELNHLATGAISFDYPPGYAVTDKSTPEAQEFVITRKGSSIQLTIIAMRRLISPNEVPAAIEDFKEPIIKKVATTLSLGDSPDRTAIKAQLGSREAEGVRLQSLDNRMRTGEVIWLYWNSRLVALSFVRADADEETGSHLWETIRSSLRVATPVVTVIGEATGASTTEGSIAGGVLNGKALALPKPAYPAIARAAHASGTVAVQVLIDEEGNVVAAHAVSGHPLLQAVSVAAAREAKFLPTKLSGQPVKVTGVIQYNFVAAPPPAVKPPDN
jgi:TonB family protein